jgi:hypothetical protein
MIDSFPYDSWDQVQTTFWTFGPVNGAAGGGSLTGTFVLTGLGVLLMVFAVGYYVWLENKKLAVQAEFLRAAGAGPGAGGPSALNPSSGPEA